MVAETLPYGILILSGQGKHLLIEIDPDDFAPRPNDLSHDIRGLSASGAEIEYRFPFSHISGRVSTAVVLLYDFAGNNFQE